MGIDLNFSAAKNYLTDLIVSTFASIQENNSVENKLLAIIQQFPFLIERRVNNLLHKKIQQAKKTVYDYEEMSKVLETSEGALKASYHHAVKKIEDYILNR